LREGESLSDVTARLTGELGIAHRVVPMSDAPVRTQVRTADGWMDFQRYFVAEQCKPVVREIRFAGTPGAAASDRFAQALSRGDLAAIVICPSNPYLSVDPILALDGVRDALAGSKAPVIAVSPLVGGRSLKGPLSKLMMELGKPEGNGAIAAHYGDLLDHLVIDTSDAGDVADLHHETCAVTLCNTVMRDAAGRARLARDVLDAVGITAE